MSGELPRVRFGERTYRVAHKDAIERLGRGALQRFGRNPDIQQTVIIGQAGLDNPTPDELRWLITSWAGGEGQKIVQPEDELSVRRYNRSVGIDLSDPSQLKLGKQMTQRAIGSGNTFTTVQGSTFTDIAGSSSAVGDDRSLNSDGAEIGHSVVSLAAGVHEVEFHAYSSGKIATVEGSTFEKVRGTLNIAGSDSVLHRSGEPTGVARSGARSLATTPVQVTLWLKGNRTPGKGARCRVYVEVRNMSTGGHTVASVRRELRSENGDYDAARPFTLGFQAIAGNTYRYYVTIEMEEKDGARGLLIDLFHEMYLGPAALLCRVMEGANVRASQRVDVTRIESTAMVVRLTFILAAAATVSFRFQRVSSPVPILADKIRYSDTTTFSESRIAELGQGGNVWVVDVDSAASMSAFKWDPATGLWSSVANFGSAGELAVAMHHSDTYEYVLGASSGVYRLDGGSTLYAAAGTGRVGLVAAANRLWLLTEEPAATKLWEVALDATAGLPLTWTEKWNPVNGIATDQTLPHRMAATNSGPVFFCNQSAECVVYEWNAGSNTGRAVSRLPGFQGRAIYHGGGLTYLAGEQPVPGGGTKASLFVIDHSVGAGEPEPLNLVFEREGESDAYLQAIQVIGSQLYVLGHVSSEPPVMRLWRISLEPPGGLFLENEVPLLSGKLTRDLAITSRTKVMISNSGGPWLSQDDYDPTATHFLRQSFFNFRFLERKRLVRLAVDGEFPTDTKVELRFTTDNGVTWISAGDWLTPESRTILTTEDDVTFGYLGLEVYPKTESSSLTPVVYSIEAVGELSPLEGSAGGKRIWDFALLCNNDTAQDRLSDQHSSGWQKAEYIYGLIAQGGAVDMEEFVYAPEQGTRAIVMLQDPQWHYMAPGEGILRVQAVER
jgi:hypothetical protein